MRSTLLALSGAALIVCAPPLPAQPDPEPRGGKVTYPITLHPAPAPKPASRAYLLPEYKDSIPGNRVQMFLRLFMEQAAFFGQEESKRRQKWNEMPLAELPAEEVKDYGGRLLRVDAVDAARMLNIDWQLWYFIQRDGYETLLPDVQKMRAIADVLKSRLRGAVRNGDHWMAIETARTMFALAKTLEQHPTLIGQLVGIAIATIACNGLEELIQQPGCPNLYWSLTDLPVPFIDLRQGLQGERVLVTAQFKETLNTKGPVSDSELRFAIKEIDKIYLMEGSNAIRGTGKGARPSERLARWAKDEKRLETARKRLIETGFQPSVVKSMTPLQAVVTDDFRQYEVYRDELFKWLNLPYPQSAGSEEVEAELKRKKDDLVLAPMLVAAAQKVKNAQTRIDQRIAYLRVLEAIRLHALGNGGKLPATLDEIKLPLPADPYTGKPFTYSVKGGVATLAGKNPIPDNERMNRVYEITVRK